MAKRNTGTVKAAAIDACYWTAGAPILAILMLACMVTGWFLELLWWVASMVAAARAQGKAGSPLESR